MKIIIKILKKKYFIKLKIFVGFCLNTNKKINNFSLLYNSLFFPNTSKQVVHDFIEIKPQKFI